MSTENSHFIPEQAMKESPFSRRDFIKKAGLLGVAAVGVSLYKEDQDASASAGSNPHPKEEGICFGYVDPILPTPKFKSPTIQHIVDEIYKATHPDEVEANKIFIERPCK